MPRGNPDNLRAAATRKSQQTVERAERALQELVRRNEPITFRSVAREAGCSEDFLYRHSELRARVEHLRGQPRPRRFVAVDPDPNSTSNVVRALTQQLRDLKQRHHQEVTELRQALAQAHGELLELRRQASTARVP
jgi:hypothetical protein